MFLFWEANDAYIARQTKFKAINFNGFPGAVVMSLIDDTRYRPGGMWGHGMCVI